MASSKAKNPMAAMSGGGSTESPHVSPFEAIKRVNEFGQECWSSRELARLLGYGDYRNFEGVLNKAIEACNTSNNNHLDHFVDITEMVPVGSGGRRSIEVVLLSRYACYLVIQNADPSKPLVAAGQTYFAVQTRRQELSDRQSTDDLEDQRRLVIRSEVREHNLKLADAAKDAGVIEPLDYAVFQNHGYKGLYGGLGAREIHQRKALDASRDGKR